MTTGRFDAPVPAQRMVTYYWLLRISPEVLKNAVPVWSRFRVRLVWCKARATGPTEVWCSSVGVLVHQVSDWCSGVAIKMGRRQGGPSRTGPKKGAYLDRYVTEEQRSRRPIFIATLRAARLLTGCFVAHRSKTTAGILPLRFAHPVKIRSSATTPVTDLVH